MNNSKLVDIFKDRNIVIPIYLLKNFKSSLIQVFIGNDVFLQFR